MSGCGLRCRRCSWPYRGRRISVSGGDDSREFSNRARGALLLLPGVGGRGLRPHLLVEAAFGFIAKPLAFEHLAEERGNLQFAALVVDVLGHVGDDVAENVETDQIDGSESCRARPAHGLAGERVDLFDGQIHLLHQAHHIQDRECADAIGDEVRRVLGQYDALAELRVAEMGDGAMSAGSASGVGISSRRRM